MFNRRLVLRFSFLACIAFVLLASVIWSGSRIRRDIEREKAIKILNANGVYQTVYDLPITEEELAEFNGDLRSYLIWNPEPTLVDRVKSLFEKKYLSIHLTVPRRIAALVPNLCDLFSDDELTIVEEGQ
jgi:hypothetical protein